MGIESDVREQPWGITTPNPANPSADWPEQIGTISSGQHNLLSETHLDTEPGGPEPGDLVMGDGEEEGRWVRLAIGAIGTFLQAGAAVLEWVQITFADIAGSLGVGQHGSLSDGDHTGTLSGNARVGVRKNSTGSTHTRRRINFIEGDGLEITIADDSSDEEVDVTIARPVQFDWPSGTGAAQLPADNTTRYMAVLGIDAPSTTEIEHVLIAPRSMTFISAEGGLQTAPGGTATRTVTLMKNGSPTSLVIEFEPNDVQASSSGGPVNFNQGDLIDWQIEGANTPDASRLYVSARYE